MSQHNRSVFIDKLAKELEMPIISYVTGDRPGLQTQISAEQVSRFPRHLEALPKSDRLGLLLYSRGGDTNVPWSIISFLREHCESLVALVPFYSHSSGTLLALGADEIIMTRYATLSPIDPTVANAFNPGDPTNPIARLPIAVEDVMSFLELAKECLDGNSVEKAFLRLSESVHPLALGNVKRSINQIRLLARKLIEASAGRRQQQLSAEDLETMVTRLTTEFYSHQHLISRKEATAMGLPITVPAPSVEALLLDYYAELRADLELLDPFNPSELLRGAVTQVQPGSPSIPGTTMAATPPPQTQVLPTLPLTLERAYIETQTTCDIFSTKGVVGFQQIQTPQGLQQAIAFEVHREGWEITA